MYMYSFRTTYMHKLSHGTAAVAACILLLFAPSIIAHKYKRKEIKRGIFHHDKYVRDLVHRPCLILPNGLQPWKRRFKGQEMAPNTWRKIEQTGLSRELATLIFLNLFPFSVLEHVMISVWNKGIHSA